MMHYGHMNAFRKGRALGTYLVVGVNSDESISQCKVLNTQTCDSTARVTCCTFVLFHFLIERGV